MARQIKAWVDNAGVVHESRADATLADERLAREEKRVAIERFVKAMFEIDSYEGAFANNIAADIITHWPALKALVEGDDVAVGDA